MDERVSGGLPFFSFNLFSKGKEVFQAITTRIGGVSPPPFDSLNLDVNGGDSPENVMENYQLLSNALGFELDTLVTCKQVHGDRVIEVRREDRMNCSFLHCREEADAMVTRDPGLFLMVRIADCIPVMFFDPCKKVVGIAHIGWRGALKKIAMKTGKFLIDKYNSDPATILTGIGPCIAPCCYEVDKKVGSLFRKSFSYGDTLIEKRGGRSFLNLWEANRRQLMETGIREENIELANLCTSCHSHIFFSHRKEKGRTGRFCALIGIRG